MIAGPACRARACYWSLGLHASTTAIYGILAVDTALR